MIRTLFTTLAILSLPYWVTSQNLSAGELIAGKQVESNANLHVGDKLVGIWEKKNYPVEILEIKRSKKLRINWGGEIYDDITATDLYYVGDATPTRKARVSPLPDTYRKLDKNSDGQIAMSEWDRAKFAQFKLLDKNHDGFLTPQELTGKKSGTGSATSAKSSKESDSTDMQELEAIENPGTLADYSDQLDKTFKFGVKGKIGGDVWGAGPYTTDSDLASAAVHAGILEDGVNGTVLVTIIKSSDGFKGSKANGVESFERSESSPAFKIAAVPESSDSKDTPR